MVKNSEISKEKKSKKDKKSKKEKKSKSEEPLGSDLGEDVQSEVEVFDAAAAVHKAEKKAKKEKKRKEEAAAQEPKVEQWSPKQLFVSGIPYDATKDQLIEFFEEQKAAITEVKMPVF